MYRKLFLVAAFLWGIAAMALAEGKAKYVFYFIGDGMGVNQVNGTETYLAALEGRIGTKPLCFPSFPHAAFVTTQSGTNGVTDSAAGGTALSTGHKTKNGTLGLLADQSTPVSSIAVWAQRAGAAVGVSTSVSVDHATPAAFYAHQASRESYYAIGQDLVKAGFDFYAGSDFLQPVPKDGATAEGTLYDQCLRAGYVIARGYDDFKQKAKAASRLVLLQTEDASKKQRNSLPYAIDRTPADMTLSEVAQAGIDFLTSRSGKDGFFLMVEGGKIDWACHGNDVGTAFRELADMDEAVRVAYAFYEQHPDETLIVVTADHETGGLSLGRGPYELHTDLLKYQRMSAEAYASHLKALHRQLGDGFTWERVEADLADNWGFGREVSITAEQKKRLHEAYDATVSGKAKDKESLYAKVGELADEARRVMAECALIGWQSGGHSDGYVPVFAVGAGAEQFAGRIDNTEIPVKIAKAAGWKAE